MIELKKLNQIFKILCENNFQPISANIKTEKYISLELNKTTATITIKFKKEEEQLCKKN